MLWMADKTSQSSNSSSSGFEYNFSQLALSAQNTPIFDHQYRVLTRRNSIQGNINFPHHLIQAAPVNQEEGIAFHFGGFSAK